MEKKIKITFDANTFQDLCQLKEENENYENLKKISNLISQGIIIPFVSESIFTYEMIGMKDRKSFLGDYEPTSITSESSDKLSFSIGANPNAHPGIPEGGKYKFDYLEKYKVKILKIYRTAIFEIEEIKPYWNDEFSDEIHEKFCDLSEYLDSNEKGLTPLEKIGLEFNPEDWQQGIYDAPESETKRISKALAEWSDCDSIATHYAHGIDIFCTNDEAKGAGQNSVMSSKSKQEIKTRYGVKFMTIKELSKYLHDQTIA